MPLSLDETQAQFITAIEAPLEQAFDSGVTLPGGTPSSLDGVVKYNELTAPLKTTTKSTFKLIVSALFKILQSNISYTTISFFLNGWSNWGDINYYNGLVRYYKDALGVVHLSGLVRAPASLPSNAAILSLPAGFRPGDGNNHVFPSVSNSNFAVFQIDGNGILSYLGTPGTNTWLNVSCSFRARA